MENNLNKLIEAYLAKYPKASGDLFTLRMELSDDEALTEILQRANGRRIVLKHEQSDLDDGPISWSYE